jgi:YD repeat-containing protein
MGEQDSYKKATEVNTRTDWLSDQKEVDLDPDGMADFAQTMKTIQDNLQSERLRLTDLNTVPMKAWDGPVLGEADFLRTRMAENATELSQYLARLATGLLNIGMAAQTISDTYGAADGFNAIELNTVRYAFAEPGANRPAGLPGFVTGETYAQKMAAATRPGATPPGEQPRRTGGPTKPAPTADSGGGKVTTQTHADGSQTVTKRNAEGEITEQVRTAPQTPGAPPFSQSPRKQALDSIEGMY